MADNRESRFNGKVAVVTGGTQGLGEAAARLFAERGAKGIVICGRNADKGRAVAADIGKTGTKAEFVKADLADLAQARAVIAAADKAFGRLDILVNAAGITDRGTIFDTSPELFDRMMAVNLRTPFFLIQDAAAIMRRGKIEGSIVNVQSMAAHGGQPFICAYSAAKGGLATLTRNAAFSLLPYRIRVNGLNLGWMDTPGEDATMRKFHGAKDGWRDEAAKGLPFGRLIAPKEAARAIAYLASDESGMLTGANIDFDQSVTGSYESPPRPAMQT